MRECREGGIDCRVHALRVLGRQLAAEEAAGGGAGVHFLASDGEEVRGGRRGEGERRRA